MTHALWVKVLIWIGLFVATAATDWIAVRWLDSTTPKQRAWLSASHEAVGLIAGFTVFAIYKSLWMAVPCIVGAWVGSYFGGVSRPEEGLDTDLVVACKICTQPFLSFTADADMCPLCSFKDQPPDQKNVI